MRTQLPAQFGSEQCMVINLDNDMGEGTHWVGAYHMGDKILYFDSFGMPPPEELRKYKKKIQHQTMQVQEINSVRCGWYVIYFLNEISKGESYYDLIYFYDILNQNKNENQLKEYFIKLL